MERILDIFEKYVDHYRKLEEDLEELKSEFRVLKRRKIDINSRIEAEVRHGQKVKKDVRGWLKAVKKIKKDIKDVKKRVHSGVPFYGRVSLDKLVRKKIEVVKRIQERGNFNEGLVIERAPARGIRIPTENIEGEISKGEIQKHLMDDQVGMIGVCGIGGVGKTTIMKHINNDLLRDDRFQKVIWVTVSYSYPLNVFELQKKIVDAMHETLQEVEEMRRAAELTDIMGRKSFVLILDDVWDNFSLMNVGIPEPVQNKSKVVITTRSIEVCKSLDCQIVKVQPLSPEESLNLFLEKVGRDVLQKVSGLEETLKLIVEECDGLPLAIVVIAGSLKGEDDIAEWRNALNELRLCVRSVKYVEDAIFGRLRFSYDRLRIPEIQQCFLYCSLFREDYEFVREELIEEWIDEGLIVIDELGSRQEAYNRGRAILNQLLQNCLLEECVEKTVKMHDVVRDMAIKSIGPGCGYLVKAGMKLEEVPNESKWVGDLKKLGISKCSAMRKLVPLELRHAFQNLELIIVSGCRQMEEIIASSDSDTSSSNKLSLTFPKLQELTLVELDQLKSICSDEAVMVCDSIERIEISNCPKLNRIPLQLPLLDNGQPSPPPHLRKIGIKPKEWWESVVELDHPNAKNILQPFLEFHEWDIDK
ncbi:hypothetical protein SLEP1_g4968 [Rubroshorea leprosula]|uniref:NB-ARC domain-containing protein n=1 Tax=Rubroshorea leprosula TaxID=152421 RepID=A0AAV5HQF5_9ROSI|nr:hypothetical protein SLEP1_g4968 [Rubroshorea leprosula]